MFDTITEQQLKVCVPSIFTEEGAETTSERYTPISTMEIARSLGKEGFYITDAQQSGSRREGGRDYAKHLLRFRHVNTMKVMSDTVPEIVLINSFDGKCAYRLLLGAFRSVCCNGLIAGQTYTEVRVRHQGDIVGNVIEGTYSVVENSHKMLESVSEMKAIQLNDDQKMGMAKKVYDLRFKKDDSLREYFKPNDLLRVRRYEEQDEDDLFTVFNILQENIIRGGITAYSYRGWNRSQRTLRPVENIDKKRILNQSLWSLAEEMKKAA